MSVSASDKLLIERIEKRSEGMSPKLREAAIAMANAIVETCSSELERSSALTHLEEVLLWAAAGSHVQT